MTGRLGRDRPGVMARLLPLLLLILSLLLPATPSLAVAPVDSASPPEGHVLDSAEVLSRASTGELGSRLANLESDHISANLVTVKRLDYNVDLDSFASELLSRWHGSDDDSDLLIAIDSGANAASIAADATLLQRLPNALLESTAEETMSVALRDGGRYRQATVDGLSLLETVLAGQEDPGSPVLIEQVAVVSNVPTKEETEESNALIWVAVPLVLGTLVPMATWWVFSR